MPKVSVVIPTYQSVRFVGETIDSVLAQTYTDYEVIVVDGGSTDGTREVLSSYGDRVKIIMQNNKGISDARNIGVLASKGEYIAFIDSDDVWLPDKLEVQVEFLESKPNSTGLIYSDALFFMEEDDNKPRKQSFELHTPFRGRVLKRLLRDNFIPASTVMISKSCFEEVGYFDESLAVCEDLDMWIRVAESFEIDYQNIVLARIRWHSGSALSDRERHFQSLIALRNKITPHLVKNFESKNFYKQYYEPYLSFGTLYLLTKELDKAKQKLRQYIRLYPYNMRAYFPLLLALFASKVSGRLKFPRFLPRGFGQRLYKSAVG